MLTAILRLETFVVQQFKRQSYLAFSGTEKDNKSVQNMHLVLDYVTIKTLSAERLMCKAY